MGTAIKIMIKRIALPCLIIGLIIGAVFVYRINPNRPVHYKITEKCYGDDCQMFVDKAKEMKEEYDTELTKARTAEETAKKTATEKTTETEKIKADYAVAQTILLEAYPSEFYCYTNNGASLNFMYQEPTQVSEVFAVREIGLREDHLYSCALCEFQPEDYSLVCHGKDEWEPLDAAEYDLCKPCMDDQGRIIEKPCRTGIVNKTTTIQENKTISFELKRDKINVVEIPENFTYEQKLELTKALKEHKCYASRQIEESSLYDVKRDIYRKQSNDILLGGLNLEDANWTFTVKVG